MQKQENKIDVTDLLTVAIFLAIHYFWQEYLPYWLALIPINIKYLVIIIAFIRQKKNPKDEV